MKPVNSASLSWQATISFITVATLIILLISWLIIIGALPLRKVMDYSNSELKFIKFWLKLAILIGILLPGATFFVVFRHLKPRKVLGFYLLVLISQIVTEQISSTMFFPSIVVIIGTIYTTFRLWQLWQGQQVIATSTELGISSRRLLRGLLWLMLIFWLSNLIMLFVLPWSSIKLS